MNPIEMIAAMRVPDSIRPGRVGPWEISRVSLEHIMRLNMFMAAGIAPFRSLTMLFRDTLATLHQPLGECVMEDSPTELRRHLPIMIHGRGRILISGLGLGCVVRGLLAKREVEHIDVVEIDPSIVALVGKEFIRNDRVSLHIGDAETIEWPDDARWDYAWHDVWSDQEALQVVHGRLMARYSSMCAHQGAWQFPREAKRSMPSRYIGGPRRRRLSA